MPGNPAAISAARRRKKERLKAKQELKRQKEEAMVERHFKKFDTNQNGQIELAGDELKNFITAYVKESSGGRADMANYSPTEVSDCDAPTRFAAPALPALAARPQRLPGQPKPLGPIAGTRENPPLPLPRRRH